MIIFVTSNADLSNNSCYSFIKEPFLLGSGDSSKDENYMKCFKVIRCSNDANKKSLDFEESTYNADIMCMPEALLETITVNHDQNCVLLCNDLLIMKKELETLKKRPCFIHLHVEIPLSMMLMMENISKEKTLAFILEKEKHLINFCSLYKNPSVNVSLQHTSGIAPFSKSMYLSLILQIPIFQYDQLSTQQGISSPHRPSWDQYFMQLANLASSRSNCMKRKVGCCIVSNNKVVATGYNGTPRNLLNCFSGGCKRCNGTRSETSSSQPQNVHTLGTCFCLHAEENALLEAGNTRIAKDSVLYCDTCPCITCSVKIVQAGISEVVYSQSYNMDAESFGIFAEAGVKIRQFDHGGVKKDYTFLI